MYSMSIHPCSPVCVHLPVLYNVRLFLSAKDADPGDSDNGSPGGVHVGAIVGSVIAIVVVLGGVVLIIIIYMYLVLYKKKQRNSCISCKYVDSYVYVYTHMISLL